MSDQFTEALESTEQAQAAYGNQFWFVDGRTPFTAELLPDASVAVRTNGDLLREVASHILNRAGHVSVIDERGWVERSQPEATVRVGSSECPCCTRIMLTEIHIATES